MPGLYALRELERVVLLDGEISPGYRQAGRVDRNGAILFCAVWNCPSSDHESGYDSDAQ